MKQDADSKEMTVREFAKGLGVSHDTVLRLLHAGKIKGRKINPFATRVRFLIPTSELTRVKKLMADESKELSKSS